MYCFGDWQVCGALNEMKPVSEPSSQTASDEGSFISGDIIHTMSAKKPITGLVTGCFDILHVGHIHFLKHAKSRCNRLVVGINSDAIIKKIKGEKRPINASISRKELLLSLKYVDEVFVFDTWLIEPVVAQYKPDIYFISEIDPGEKVKTEVAKKYRSRLVKIPMHESYGKISTTAIVSKMYEEI